MDQQPMILLVEDDDLSAKITTRILASNYIVHHVSNGQDALDFIARQTPDLLLLDVFMPGMSGYDVCRTLRKDTSANQFPIIFLSGMDSEEDHLAGYEAGGDDYLNKPVTPADLLQKIGMLLRHYTERSLLKQELDNIAATAKKAMLSVAEMGILFHFFQASFKCLDYDALCREVLKTIAHYGAEGSVQIRGRLGMASFGSKGPSSPLEESVLTNMAAISQRMSRYGSGSSSLLAYSYGHITIIVKNIDLCVSDQQGRLADNLALLTEGADIRIMALDDSAGLKDAHQQIGKLIAAAREVLTDIDKRHQQQRIECEQIFRNLQDAFKHSLLTVDIAVDQKEGLTALIQSASQRALALYDRGIQVGKHMTHIKEQLEEPASF